MFKFKHTSVKLKTAILTLNDKYQVKGVFNQNLILFKEIS